MGPVKSPNVRGPGGDLVPSPRVAVHPWTQARTYASRQAGERALKDEALKQAYHLSGRGSGRGSGRDGGGLGDGGVCCTQ